MTSQNAHKAGIWLVALSALTFSTAGIFTRGVSAEAWIVIFWRGLAAAAFTLSYLGLRGQLRTEIRNLRGPGLLVSALGAAATAAFIPAFKLSSVANVALIYAAAPFVAAALAWLVIGERPKARGMIASLASCIGVALILSGSVGRGHIAGDLLALLMTILMAAMMVVYRLHPQTPAALPAALSSLLLLPVALIFANPLDVAGAELPVLLGFGLVFALASVTLQEGARRLPAADTALISTLEMPLAPLLAFLVLAERPMPLTLLGGAVIFVAVVWSQTGRRPGARQNRRLQS